MDAKGLGTSEVATPSEENLLQSIKTTLLLDLRPGSFLRPVSGLGDSVTDPPVEHHKAQRALYTSCTPQTTTNPPKILAHNVPHQHSTLQSSPCSSPRLSLEPHPASSGQYIPSHGKGGGIFPNSAPCPALHTLVMMC